MVGSSAENCDICYANKCDYVAKGDDGNEVQCKAEVIPSVIFPGSEGSLSLNGYLRVYFIVTKLLRLPESEFLKLWPQPHYPRKRFKGEDEEDGGEGLLYSSICTKCELIVNEAINLHQQVVALQRKIDKLGETLFEMKEIGQRVRGQERKRKVPFKSSKGHPAAKEMRNISLACLGGLATPKAKVPSPSPKRSVKEILRKQKSTAAIKSNVSSRDPLELDHLEINGVTCDENLEIKGELMDGGDERIHDQIDTMATPPRETLNYSGGGNGGDSDDDDPDNDDDYIPTESTDEEMGEDDDDLDYAPEGTTLQNTRKSSKQALTSKETYDESDNNSESEEDELEAVELVVTGGIGDIMNPNLPEGPATTDKTTAFENQCPECSAIFPRRQNLEKHTLTMHGFETTYSCPKCPELKFRRRGELVRHRKSVHGSTCEKCGKRLSKIDALIEHYKRIHKITFTYNCPLCKMRFKTRLELRTHRSKVHVPSSKNLTKLPPRPPKTDEEKMWASNPCAECGKVFLSGTKLGNHLTSMHEYKLSKEHRKANQRKCYFCWHYFTLEQRHWVHLKTAHPDKTLQFPCIPCSDKNMVFQTVSELLGHFETDHAQETIYTCSFCKWPFLDNKALKEHKKGHVHKKPDPDLIEVQKLAVCQFNCWFCWELFPTEDKLQHHLKTNRRHRKRLKVEFPCDDWECDRSERPFATMEELISHLRDAHGDREVVNCDRCSWRFLNQDMLKLHKMNHVPRRAGQYKCPDCDHVSVQLVALKNHYNSYHGLNIKMWRCAYCDDRFETRHGRDFHKTQKHGHDDQYNEELKTAGLPCDQCGKLFRSEKALKMHQTQYHGQFKCPECGMEFHSNAKYKTHRKKEHNFGILHLCQVCGKRFLEKHLLLKHVAVHTGKRFECHLCGKMMISEATFKTHMKKVHQNDKPGPSQKFVCGECGRGYSRKDTLDDHVRVKHTQETYRVWQCSLCGKRFKRQQDLETHTAFGTACFLERVTLKDTTTTEVN